MDKKKSKGFIDPVLPSEKSEGDNLTSFQREQMRKKFIGRAPGASLMEEEEMKLERNTERVSLSIRVPRYYLDDIERIHKLTGQTKNSIYIDLLRSAIRSKLKELTEAKE